MAPDLGRPIEPRPRKSSEHWRAGGSGVAHIAGSVAVTTATIGNDEHLLGVSTAPYPPTLQPCDRVKGALWLGDYEQDAST
jgi:hypothetical protein